MIAQQCERSPVDEPIALLRAGSKKVRASRYAGAGGGPSGFWYRFRFRLHWDSSQMLTGGRLLPEITTVDQAVSFLRERIADWTVVQPLGDAVDDARVIDMLTAVAAHLESGRLSGQEIDGESSYAWRLVEDRG